MDEASQKRQEALLYFGGFTLNILRRGLYRGQERVRLTAKPLETLIFLVENCGRVVGKQEILNAVWKGTFVTEDTLVHAIREIRRALADDRDNPRFILTVPREGYRFVCQVLTTQPDSETLQVSSGSETSPDLSLEPKTSTTAVLAARVPKRATLLGWWKRADIGESPRPRRWLIPLVSGFLILVATIWIAWQASLRQRLADWLGNGATQSLTPFRADSQRLLTTEEFSEGKPALCGNGKLLLYVSSRNETAEKTRDGKIKTYGDLFVKEVATGHTVQITYQENPSGDIPVFTADNDFVVFSNYPKTENGSSLPNLYKVGSGGGRVDHNGAPVFEKPLPFIKEASGAGFSPDGKWVAYTKHLPSRKELWLGPANNPEVKNRVVVVNGFTPRWSADGKWLAYTTSNPNGGLGDIWVVDAATLSGQRNMTNEPQQIYGFTWTPDNRFLIFSSKRTGPSLLWRVPFEGGPVHAVTGPVGDFSAPSMSRDGSMLVFSYYHGAQNLFISEGLSAEARDLTNDEYHKFVRLSPSGQYVATVMEQPDFGEHLYVTDLLGNHTRLSDHASHHPSWSGERKVCYLQWDQSTQQTQVIRVDITDLKKPVLKTVTTFPGKAEWLDVNPADETKLVVVLTAGGSQQIVLRDLAKTKDMDTVIASGLEYAALRWSADGSTLAWSGPAEAGKLSGGIWLIKPGIETAPRRPVTEGYGPVWSADNSVIYFARIGAQSRLWEKNLKTNKETPRRDWKQTSSFDLVGRRLVFCELGSSGKNRVYSLTVALEQF